MILLQKNQHESRSAQMRFLLSAAFLYCRCRRIWTSGRDRSRKQPCIPRVRAFRNTPTARQFLPRSPLASPMRYAQHQQPRAIYTAMSTIGTICSTTAPTDVTLYSIRALHHKEHGVWIRAAHVIAHLNFSPHTRVAAAPSCVRSTCGWPRSCSVLPPAPTSPPV